MPNYYILYFFPFYNPLLFMVPFLFFPSVRDRFYSYSVQNFLPILRFLKTQTGLFTPSLSLTLRHPVTSFSFHFLHPTFFTPFNPLETFLELDSDCLQNSFNFTSISFLFNFLPRFDKFYFVWLSNCPITQVFTHSWACRWFTNN